MRNFIFNTIMAASACIYSSNNAWAQGMAVNTSGSAAAASAVLDASSTTQGMLVPRMTSGQRTGIASPAQGLLVYQTDAPAGFYYYESGAWVSLSTPSNATLQGNSFNSASQLVQLNGSTQLPAVSGVNLTNLNAGNLSTGTVNDGRLSSNVTLGGNTFNGASQLVKLDGSSQLPAAGGANLTGLNASQLTTGTISVNRFNSGTGASTSTFLRGDGTWVAPSGGGGGGGATVDLIATNTSTTQTLTGGTSITVSFNTTNTTPTIGSFTSGTTYTAGATGAYLVGVSIAAASPLAGLTLFATVVSSGGTATYQGPGASASNNYDGGTLTNRVGTTFLVYMNSGEALTVHLLNLGSGTTTLSGGGITRLMVVKL